MKEPPEVTIESSPRWEIARAWWSEKHHVELDALLAEGWEPFGVMGNIYGYSYHLKRKAPE